MAYLPVLLVPLALLAATKPTNFGDAPWYAGNLVSYEKGDFRGYGSRLWEFGHLIERPVAYRVYRVVKLTAGRLLGWSDRLSARTSLVAISIACGLLLAWLFQALALSAGLGTGASFAIAILALCLNSVLTFLPSGTSYIPGCAFLTLALWINVASALQGRDTTSSALWAGAALGISVLFWVPYLFSIPAVALAGLCWGRSDWDWHSVETRRRLRWSAVFLLTAACLILVFYAAAVWNLGIRSVAELRSWIASSNHGWSQSRNLLRLVSGLPRGFISLDAGITLKRYILHDPYAHVTLWQVVWTGVWKLVLFYGTAVLLAAMMLRSRRSRVALGVLAAAVAPVIAFALYFEAGSVERYLPICPFLVLALAVTLVEVPKNRFVPVLMLLSVSIAVTNVSAMWRPAVNREWSRELRRMDFLSSEGRPGDQVWTVGNDGLPSVAEVFPYDARSSGNGLQFEDLVPVAGESMATWREDFAASALRVLERGGRVWISERALADVPQPEWGWTEGDDPRISWPAMTAFVRGLDLSPETDPDKFALLRNTPASRDRLKALSSGGRKLRAIGGLLYL